MKIFVAKNPFVTNANERKKIPKQRVKANFGNFSDATVSGFLALNFRRKMTALFLILWCHIWCVAFYLTESVKKEENFWFRDFPNNNLEMSVADRTTWNRLRTVLGKIERVSYSVFKQLMKRAQIEILNAWFYKWLR